METGQEAPGRCPFQNQRKSRELWKPADFRGALGAQLPGGHSGSADSRGRSGSADSRGRSGSEDTRGALWETQETLLNTG